MNKVQQDSYAIEQAFAKGKAFIGFLTAGDPNLEATARYIKVMADAGADLVEIGIPFSDPVAEGEVIQRVQKVRETVTIPLVFMTYLNPVYVYGAEKFFARCQALNIRGIIVPDMPYEEKGEIEDVAAAAGVTVISLIAPTSEQRIERIASDAKGFVYCVSSLGVTGVRKEITTDIAGLVQTIKKYTDVPVAIGFGIAEPEQAKAMAAVSDGAIVGSAIVKIIEAHGDAADEALGEYVKTMKAAVLSAV